MECILDPDTAIVSIHCGKSEGEGNRILYRNPSGCLQTIDFAPFAANFRRASWFLRALHWAAKRGRTLER